MKLDIREYLINFIQNDSTIEDKDAIQVPDAIMETDDIQMIMISEVVPQNPNDYFYSGSLMGHSCLLPFQFLMKQESMLKQWMTLSKRAYILLQQ